ncbi:unnamed protein product [Mytilus coruscus]|uniref:Peptidase A2 domain-containing protein n=1 Tax=Mytilus coruscus TaxID=42192 RepID=A0A6J8A3H2_MYTCO|nr:unnamed protein product [Mytilus coruscus]
MKKDIMQGHVLTRNRHKEGFRQKPVKLKRAETNDQVSGRNCKIKSDLIDINQTHEDQVDRNIECVFLGKGIEHQMVNSASSKEKEDFVAEPMQEDHGLSLNGDCGQDTGAEKDVIFNNNEDIVIDRITAASFRVSMEGSNQKVKTVIDTGAEVTVLYEDIFFSAFQKQADQS